MTHTLISLSGVTYLNEDLHKTVKKEANSKFPKNSYTKNLWILREYKKRGGKVKYDGKKPSPTMVRKQVGSYALEICLEIDIAEELWKKELPAEIEAARGSADPEVRDLLEDLETYHECLAEVDFMPDFIEVAAEKKKNVKLNKPFRTPGGPKKFAVYVRNKKGNIVLVRFGDPGLEIKRDDPERRRNFRARHGCDNPGPKWKAKYWSCRMWTAKPVSKIVGEDEPDEAAAAHVNALAEVFGAVEEVLE